MAGAGWQSGAGNQDLTGPYIPPAAGKQYDPASYGGYNSTVTYDDQGNPVYHPDQSGAGDAVTRYQAMANKQAPAPQLDQSQMDQSRGMSMGALGLVQQRAQGRGPSAAEIAGQNAMNQSLDNSLAVAGSARGGPMQQQAAIRNAQQTRAAQQQAMANNIQAGRAAEIAQAQGQYMQGTNAMQRSDLATASTNAELQARQNALNEQRQEYFEGLGNKVNEDQLNANLGSKAESDLAWYRGREATMQNDQQESQNFKDMLSAETSMFSGGMSGMAHGGQMASKRPYLVGEEGPELIVPKHDGFVLTAPQTQFIKQTATPQQRRALGGDVDSGGAEVAPGTADYMHAMGGDASLNGKGAGDSDPFASSAKTRGPSIGRMMGGLGSSHQNGFRLFGRASGGPVDAGGAPTDASGDFVPIGGQNLHVSAPGRAFYASGAPDATSGASVSGATPRYGVSSYAAPSPAKRSKPAARQMTNDELAREADRQIAATRSRQAAEATRPSASQSALARSSTPSWLDNYMVSDARAKQEAFRDGMNYAQEFNDSARSAGSTAENLPRVPLYMRDKAHPPPRSAEVLAARGGPGTPRYFVEQPATVAAKDTSHAGPTKTRRVPVPGAPEGRLELADEDETPSPAPVAAPVPAPAAPPAEKPGILRRMAQTTGVDKIPENSLSVVRRIRDRVNQGLDSTEGTFANAGTASLSDKRAKEIISKEEPMRGSNLSMAASEYRYKPEFTPKGQEPGERNVGPMAQNMAHDPVAKSAVVEEPNSGLLAIDKEKGLKLVMGGLASLQRQLDALKEGTERGKKRTG